MSEHRPGAQEIAGITAYVDVSAPPPAGRATAHLVFGTNQFGPPVEIVAERHHRGLAPLVILTGGVNRHDGVVEAREFRRLLVARGVPEEAIRCEDRSANTWENVAFSLPYVHEALAAGLSVTTVSKWYHRRTVHMLATQVPGVGPFHALTWDPAYGGPAVTRAAWTATPGGRQRVLREWEESARRVADGSFSAVALVDGAWRRRRGPGASTAPREPPGSD
ncbi:YdcF family protein [Streptomyces sp. NPDC004134]|uniref:YdcF family protein n=1 Tax=Streptomyces sp. NPDC004134 TaxID=3364691 RepID=UPI0036C33AF7